MRILAVDDDPLVLMSTLMMLEELGHEVSEASSGLGALKEFDRESVDLVVTDFMMPAMNGLELMLEVRRRFPALPVLIVSGFMNLSFDNQRRVDVLSKPFSESQLAAAIRRTVTGGKTAAA